MHILKSPQLFIEDFNNFAVNTLQFNAEEEQGIRGQPPIMKLKDAQDGRFSMFGVRLATDPSWKSQAGFVGLISFAGTQDS